MIHRIFWSIDNEIILLKNKSISQKSKSDANDLPNDTFIIK